MTNSYNIKEKFSDDRKDKKTTTNIFSIMLVMSVFSTMIVGVQSSSFLYNDLGTGGSDISLADVSDQNDLYLTNDNLYSIPSLISYTVLENDTIETISAKFGVSAETIRNNNDLPNGELHPNEVIRVLPTDGLLHVVERNQNPIKIARMYNVDVNDLMYFNDISSETEKLSKNSVLIVPGAKPLDTRKNFIANNTPQPTKGELLFPTFGVYTQYYHFGHRGIDIASKSSPDIFAVKKGKILVAKDNGWNGGYGRHIIIDHEDGTRTLYGHMVKLYVSEGEEIDAGEPIGKMGNTGRSTGIHLHFEYIVNGVRVNPINYF